MQPRSPGVALCVVQVKCALLLGGTGFFLFLFNLASSVKGKLKITVSV
uniref:Uncharacterized protein n=1 Tax=Rhodnius prolixus TaxID=13249 RepID=T1HYE9_RHOPR